MPSAIPGLGSLDADATILRLLGMVQTGLDPRIPGLDFRAVPLQNGSVVIVARIPRSFAAPHMVAFKCSQRFYARNAAGKYPLDVAELRTVFTAAGLLADRMRDFRAERLARILANEGPVPLLDVPKIVLHLVPLTAFDPAQYVDLGRPDAERGLFALFAFSEPTRRLNFDGMLMYVRGDDNANLSSLQVFRSGAIESVGVLNRGDGEGLIQGEWYEQSLVRAMPSYLAALAGLGVEAPLFLMLVLVGVR